MKIVINKNTMQNDNGFILADRSNNTVNWKVYL